MVSVGVLGMNGYIGSYIYDTLLKDGIKVTSLDYRYKNLDPIELAALDVVIYTGGVTTRGLCDMLSQDSIHKSNVDNILHLASALKSSQLLVYFSTAAVYEGSGSSLATENASINTELDMYSLSMYQRENALLGLTNCTTVGLRIGMTCGISRKQRYDLAFMNMLLTSLHDGVINIDRSNPSRAIVGLHDLYRSVNTIILQKDTITSNSIFNIASFNITINTLAEYISSQMNSSLHITEHYSKKNASGFSMDTSLFCTTFKFEFHDTKESILSELIEHIDVFKRFTNKCRICKTSSLDLILDLGNQPLVNNLLTSSTDTSEAFPLNIYGCQKCFHTQLGCTIPPLKMFNFYTYVSGVSSSAIKHFKQLTEYLISSAKGKKNVLELASNDGTQLDFFKEKGFNTFGIDPAQNICELAKNRGHTIICDYWGDRDFSDLLPPSFDIILAQNVLAHVPDPVLFVNACTKYMTKDTILYLQTSQSEMYNNNEFDTIYHEHMSFFTLESFKTLAEACNLYISEMTKFPIHGISYGLTFKKKLKKESHCSSFFIHLQKEHERNMYKRSFYYAYRNNVIKFKFDFLKLLEEMRKTYTIIGYGAAAKGITMLNYIDFKYIDYIVDDCELKYGKFTPGLNIPIVNQSVLSKDKRSLCIIILPWNIKEEIIRKIKTLYSGDSLKIIIPFPSISIL